MVKDTQRDRAAARPLRRAAARRPSFPAQATHRAEQLLQALRELEFVATCARTPTRCASCSELQMEDRLRLTTEHFMVLPAIVRATDLAVVMPRNIARGFGQRGATTRSWSRRWPLRDFVVSLHWSRRFEADPGNRWLRQVITALFSEKTQAA
jgi:DNA-binding transcriptional LysR family regulator